MASTRRLTGCLPMRLWLVLEELQRALYCSHFVESRACSVLGRYPQADGPFTLSFSRQGGVDVNVLHVTCEFMNV